MADWGMDIASIEFPIALWYGSEDNMAPKERGIYYQQQLPNSTFKLIADEGHFSLIRNHLREILIELKPSLNKE